MLTNTDFIYLDYAATTPLDPRVLQAMQPYFSERFGNPSSIHRAGQIAEAAVESARMLIAEMLGCQAQEVLFTSCGSESDNLALRGVARAQRTARNANHILISPVEHDAILHTAADLAQREGFEVEFLPVDAHGRVDPAALEKRLRPDTALVSIMYANNEIGSINDIAALGKICRQHAVIFHSDAVQAASQLDIDVRRLNVDLLSLGAHKFYGPKGIGALYIRQGVKVEPHLTGGGQEKGLRAGTHNVPLIVGMAEALKWTVLERKEHERHYLTLRDRLLEAIPAQIPDARLTGDPIKRLPNHASFVFRDLDGNQLLAALDLQGFGCSSGSACKTGEPEPSKVLQALGIEADWSLGSLRVTLGRPTTSDEIDSFLDTLPGVVDRLRAAVEVNP